ncbi:hypothetical protein F511_33510 [Dorcoceras hygrometricum]|uniref:Uncharacterized protein n=1 Tax=Dorcoceras hygrometricum TaxID=472368 RepID=A0A2Z7C0V4_9LAMI|nr:hypothetical protein F511_33510 [Dorcoceras hygrometricum]
MQMLCKGSRLQPKAGSQRISKTAQQQDLIKGKANRQWPHGILSTWELPTHLQYTAPDANNQLHLLLLTHEMWELPTPLIAANKPNREMRYGSYPLTSKVYGNYPLVLEHSILTTQGRCLRHTSPASSINIRKAPQNEASQQEESNATTLHPRQSCLPPEIEEDKIDSDLVIYRTTLVRTFQVVTICRVDKSEVLVVLISPHDSK